MSDDTGRDDDANGSNRRGFLRGAAGASLASVGLVAGTGGTAAKESPVPRERAEAALDAHAGGVLETLAAEGLLEVGGVAALPTGTATAASISDEGVGRTVYDGTEFFVARRATDDGHLTVLARPGTDDALGVHSLDDGGFEVYDDGGERDVSTACACGGELCGLGAYFLFCGGFPVYCCN